MQFEPRGMEPEGRAPRRVIASYNSYAEAQRAVDYLSDERFPVERVSIVAEDLRLRGAGDRAQRVWSDRAPESGFRDRNRGLVGLVQPYRSSILGAARRALQASL